MPNSFKFCQSRLEYAWQDCVQLEQAQTSLRMAARSCLMRLVLPFPEDPCTRMRAGSLGASR